MASHVELAGLLLCFTALGAAHPNTDCFALTVNDLLSCGNTAGTVYVNIFTSKTCSSAHSKHSPK